MIVFGSRVLNGLFQFSSDLFISKNREAKHCVVLIEALNLLDNFAVLLEEFFFLLVQASPVRVKLFDQLSGIVRVVLLDEDFVEVLVEEGDVEANETSLEASL